MSSFVDFFIGNKQQKGFWTQLCGIHMQCGNAAMINQPQTARNKNTSIYEFRKIEFGNSN